MEENITKISFRISTDEKDALAQYAEENDLSISQVIRRAIKMFLKSIEEE